MDSLLDFEKKALDMQPEFDFKPLDVPELRERYGNKGRRGAQNSKTKSNSGSEDADMDLDPGEIADSESDSGDENKDEDEDGDAR